LEGKGGTPRRKALGTSYNAWREEHFETAARKLEVTLFGGKASLGKRKIVKGKNGGGGVQRHQPGGSLLEARKREGRKKTTKS